MSQGLVSQKRRVLLAKENGESAKESVYGERFKESGVWTFCKGECSVEGTRLEALESRHSSRGTRVCKALESLGLAAPSPIGTPSMKRTGQSRSPPSCPSSSNICIGLVCVCAGRVRGGQEPDERRTGRVGWRALEPAFQRCSARNCHLPGCGRAWRGWWIRVCTRSRLV